MILSEKLQTSRHGQYCRSSRCTAMRKYRGGLLFLAEFHLIQFPNPITCSYICIECPLQTGTWNNNFVKSRWAVTTAIPLSRCRRAFQVFGGEFFRGWRTYQIIPRWRYTILKQWWGILFWMWILFNVASAFVILYRTSLLCAGSLLNNRHNHSLVVYR
jgi:hypothetical protein